MTPTNPEPPKPETPDPTDTPATAMDMREFMETAAVSLAAMGRGFVELIQVINTHEERLKQVGNLTTNMLRLQSEIFALERQLKDLTALQQAFGSPKTIQ